MFSGIFPADMAHRWTQVFEFSLVSKILLSCFQPLPGRHMGFWKSCALVLFKQLSGRTQLFQNLICPCLGSGVVRLMNTACNRGLALLGLTNKPSVFVSLLIGSSGLTELTWAFEKVLYIGSSSCSGLGWRFSSSPTAPSPNPLCATCFRESFWCELSFLFRPVSGETTQNLFCS